MMYLHNYIICIRNSAVFVFSPFVFLFPQRCLQVRSASEQLRNSMKLKKIKELQSAQQLAGERTWSVELVEGFFLIRERAWGKDEKSRLF